MLFEPIRCLLPQARGKRATHRCSATDSHRGDPSSQFLLCRTVSFGQVRFHVRCCICSPGCDTSDPVVKRGTRSWTGISKHEAHHPAFTCIVTHPSTVPVFGLLPVVGLCQKDTTSLGIFFTYIFGSTTLVSWTKGDM